MKLRTPRLNTAQKIILIMLCEFVTLACGVAAYYIRNPIWMIFSITTILISAAIRACIFLSFAVKHISFVTAPELSQKIIERDRKIMELETKFKIIEKNEPKGDK